MDLTLGTGSTSEYKNCPNCKSKYLSAKRLILDRDNAIAVVFFEAHRHTKEPEIYFMCILGNWVDNDYRDNVTFACRYGKVEGQKEYACTLIDVPKSFSPSLAGRVLTRNEGLKNDKINEFWYIVDFLIDSDITIHDFLHHPLKSKIKTLLT